MQLTITAMTLFLAASAAAQPAPVERRQSGTTGLGGACQLADDCIGNLNCISNGQGLICSRNLGLGTLCAQNADCNSFNCGTPPDGGFFKCLP